MIPKVTVIIPAYNAEQFIEECVRSVLDQTLKEIEVILIDDGSTDRTGSILEELTVGRENVKLIHQENKGLYKSREIGLSIATGEYIGWVDADDFVSIKMYEVLYNTAVENNSELVICDYSWFPGAIATKGKWFREYNGVVDASFVEHNSQPWNKIVRRELMDRLQIGSFFTTCFDDIYIRLLMEARNPVTIREQLYNYRINSGSMSIRYKNVNHYERFVKASKNLRKIMKPVINNTYWADYFDYRIIYYLLMTMIVSANSNNKDIYESSKKEFLGMSPRNNQHFWSLIKEDFGIEKGFAICWLVPVNYNIANMITNIFM